MVTYTKVVKKKLAFAICSVFFASSLAHADTQLGGHDSYSNMHEDHYGEDTGLIESLTGYKYNESSFMKALGVKFGGWTEIGFAGNVDTSKSSNGNGPVTFNDGPNEFKLHQVYGFIEREVDTSSDTINFGFRADLLYGTDARFTRATNFDNSILDSNGERQLAFPQAYVDVFLPIGNGIVATMGHFYTLIGYEVVPAAGNFFFSHAYTMQYGEPFTHSGGYLTYEVNDNITVRGGAVTGWDAHFDQPVNFLGSVEYTTDDERTSLTASLITGSVETIGPNSDHNRTMYSIVLEHDLTDRLHYVLQHDLGVESRPAAAGVGKAQWYGINQYLFYDIKDNLAAGLRMEWFRDDDGARVIGDGRAENFIGVTGGLNYTPIAGFTIRPEVRYDRTTNNKVFESGRDNDQIMLSVSGIFRF